MGVLCLDSMKQTPCSVRASAVLQQPLPTRRPSSGHRADTAVQLWLLADCSEVRSHLGLPYVPPSRAAVLPATASLTPCSDSRSHLKPFQSHR